MNAKENALEVIRFGRPERVPFQVPFKRVSYLGCDHQGYEGGGHHLPVGSRWKDIWGTEWHREHEGVMGFPRGNPLADFPAAMRGYSWPDPDDERITRRIHELADKHRAEGLSEHFLAGAHRDTLWEKSYMLCGMENMMTYFYTEPEYAKEILRRIMDFQLGMAKHYLKLGVEFVHFGDDLGTQNGPLLGPSIVLEFLVPEYRRLFDLYKKHDVLINFHSCGNMDSVIDVFMDLGVNVLNPLQATANDLPALRRRVGKRMAFLGGISTGLIMEGPIERIRAEVKKRIAELGREGGYFCAPDQGMPFPEAHKKAFEEAVEEFGSY